MARTRHTWRLATSSFELDFTWSRQEGGPALATAPAAQALPAPAPTRAAQPRPLPSFAEVLKRQQLAGLLMMPSRPPADRTPLSRTDQRAPALPGQVCRAYAQGLGPLAAPASRCFMA
ncbi:MAG: hypothetical protein C0405_14405 [Desulfovibrio sp.]|nr:hypothetical protein [Desulfovibrio sp.]